MKYAIVESGGKQYKAIEGGQIEVDRLNLETGKKVTLEDVLLVSDDGKITVGTPVVEGAKISATVVEEFKGPKVLIYKYHPRKRYRLKKGHRQWYTRLQIEKIAVKAAKQSKAKKETEEPAVEAAAEE